MGKNLSCAAPALLFAFLAPAQQNLQDVAVRSLRDFEAPGVMVGTIGFATALPGESRNMPRCLGASAQRQPTSWVVDLLAQRHAATLDGQLDVQLLSQRPDGGGEAKVSALALRGARGAVESYARDLDAIAAVLHRPIEVTAFRLPLPAATLPPTVFAPDALRPLLDAAPALWTARGHVRSGGGLRLADERWIAHVRDYDVEVAEKSRIDDPKVDAAFAGWRLGLCVHELPGDQLLLDGEFLLSEPAQVTEQATGGTNRPTVDLPDHRTAFLTFAGCVANGGALAVSGRGGGLGPEGFLFVVRARFLAPAAAGLAADLLVRPVSALTQREPRAELPTATFVPGDDGPLLASLGPTDFGCVREGELAALVGHEQAECSVVAGALVAAGTAESCRAVDTALQTLLRDQLRTVELRSAVTAANGSAALEVAQPALLGRPALAFTGREQATVVDFEVEIANRAQLGNPVVMGQRSGLWSRCRVLPRGEHFAVEGTWFVAAQGPRRDRAFASEPPMALQLGSVRMAAFPWDAPMPPDQAHELGDAPPGLAGDGPARLAVRLTKR